MQVYSYAESLSGPWSEWTEFAPVDSKTFKSQVSYIQPLGTDNAIYIGDRWVDSNLAASTYIWLPLTISGTDVKLEWHDSWAPDVAKGTWSERGSETSHEAEDADLANGAIIISCGECSGDEAAGYIGGGTNGIVTFDNVKSTSNGRETINVAYRNGDIDSRHAQVSVNGVLQPLAFLSTRHHHSSEIGISSLSCELKEGSNTIVFSTSDDTWGPDVDRLLVPGE